MAVHHSATHPTQSFSLGEVLRIVGVALIAGTAIGYLIAHYDDETLDILARIFGIVAMVTVVHMIFDARRVRRIDRMNQGLEQIGQRLDERPEPQRCEACYAEGYVDGIQRRPPNAGTGERHLRSI